MVSKLDVVYRKLLLHKFFPKGWGPAQNLLDLFAFRNKMNNREECYKLVPKDYPIEIVAKHNSSDHMILEGQFYSPFALYNEHLMPNPVKTANFQMIIPHIWNSSNYKPVCIHLAGTGDHFYWRRRTVMAYPLLKDGIGALILENPFYGFRRPVNQSRSSLTYVSDIFVMGACLILECIALFNWLDRSGFGPLGVSGLSMGGHMASLAASNYPKPIVLVPCLSWSTASSVFTEGVMSDSIDWKMLQAEFLQSLLFRDVLSKSCRIIDSPFVCNENDVPDVLLKSKRIMNMKIKNKEALWFMRAIMDEFTHLKNFSVPFDTSLIIAIYANADGYVPRDGVATLESLWPGATVKYIDTGHVGGYIWKSIVEAFKRAEKIVPPPPHMNLDNLRLFII